MVCRDVKTKKLSLLSGNKPIEISLHTIKDKTHSTTFFEQLYSSTLTLEIYQFEGQFWDEDASVFYGPVNVP